MDEVKTGVDELMEILTKEKKISLPDAAKRLKQSESAIQNWVDFLVEERLVGIEYKFTTPFIYLNEPKKASVLLGTAESMDTLLKDFIKKAKEKGMPSQKLKALWENHVSAAIDSRQDFFMQECKKRKLTNDQELFKRYKEKVIKEYELRITN